MKTRVPMWLPIAIFSFLASGCVSQKEFDKYKAEAELTDKILLCESKVDAYQDLVGSDEPNPTRRDEPSSTRRDQACEADYTAITQGNAEKCSVDMDICIDADIHTNQACRACENSCLASGTWPTAGAGSCPP